MPAKNYFEIRYEDFIVDPQLHLKHVLDFLEEPFVDTTQDYFKKLDKKNIYQLNHSPLLSKPINRGHIGCYLDEMTSKEIDLFDAVAGPALLHCGYPALGRRKPPSSVQRFFYRLDNKVRFVAKKIELANKPRISSKALLLSTHSDKA